MEGICSNLYDGTTKQLRKFIGVVLWITGINLRWFCDLFKVGILFKMTHLFENEPVYDDTFLSHRLARAFDDMQHAYYAGFVCEYGVKKLRSKQNSI